MLPEKLIHGKEYDLGYGVMGHFSAEKKAFFISEGPGLPHEGFWLKMTLTVFVNYEKEGRIMDKIDVALENTKRILEDDQDQIKDRLEAEKKGLDSAFAGLPVEKEDQYIDVRLRIQHPAQGQLITWALKFGDSQFDQDHRGFWACGYIDQYTDPKGLFQDLKNDVLDYISMADDDNYDLD